MGTIRKEISTSGYCVIDKDNVPIPIEYNSFPQPNESRKNMTFVKNNNLCSYLNKGKCNLGRECQIYKDAEPTIQLDVSNLRF